MSWKQRGTFALGAIYLLYLVKNLKVVTDPPSRCTEGSEERYCIPPLLDPTTPFTLHLVASNQPIREVQRSSTYKLNDGTSILVPKSSDPTHRVEWIGSAVLSLEDELSCHPASPRILHGTGGVEPYEDKGVLKKSFFSSKKCATILRWKLSDEWKTNSTNLHLLSYGSFAGNDLQALPIAHAIDQINILYRPEKRASHRKQYLLTGEIDDTSPFHKYGSDSFNAVPRAVRVGPVVLTGSYNKTDFILKTGAYLASPQGYRLPASINKLISPRDEYQSIVSPDEEAEIKFELLSESWRQFRVENLMTQSIQMLENKLGTTQYEADSLKLLISGESHILLLLTLVVSVLHSVLEILALGTSWSFFQDTLKDENLAEGISKRALGLDLIFELLILIWLRDEGEAQLVQIMILLRILLGSYKYYRLTRAHGASETRRKAGRLPATPTWRELVSNPLMCLKPSTLRQWRKKYSVDEFEKLCLKSLSIFFVPFMIGLAAYQLVYVPQRSWKSWAIKSLALWSYAGGFIAMTPQLYRNFHRQSVESLPWTTLTYQFLNTIIDDLFSLLIRMPKEHRVSVFRDDIIFVIYWIQKRHYKKKEALQDEAVADVKQAPIRRTASKEETVPIRRTVSKDQTTETDTVSRRRQ